MNRINQALVAFLFWTMPSALIAQYDRQNMIKCISTFGVKDYLELTAAQSDELTPLLPKSDRLLLGNRAKVVFKKSKSVSHDLIVVEVADMFMIPGASLAQVHFFRANGSLIKSNLFNIGYRQYFHTIKVVKNLDMDSYLIEIRTSGYPVGSSAFNKPAPPNDWQPRRSKMTVQLYAFDENEVRLIRLTDEEGNPRSNPIYVKHFNYGPLCEYSLEKIEKLLQSSSIVDQLHALVWLNGRHHRPCYADQWYDYQSESRTSIAAYKEAYSSASLAKILDDKIKHSNSFISSQAKWVRKKLSKSYDYIDPNE